MLRRNAQSAQWMNVIEMVSFRVSMFILCYSSMTCLCSVILCFYRFCVCHRISWFSFCFLTTSQEIGWEAHLQIDPFCVEWGIKLYSVAMKWLDTVFTTPRVANKESILASLRIYIIFVANAIRS